MAEKKIYSENAEFQILESIKNNRNKRYRQKKFFVEGVRNINEAIKNGWTIASLLYSGERKLSGWAQSVIDTAVTEINYILTDALMAKLSSKTDTSELLALVGMRRDDEGLTDFPPDALFVLFDRPSNKGNLGSIIRSCDSFGATGMIITGHAVDLYDPDVVSASQGSFFNLRVIRLSEMSDILNFIEKARSKLPGLRVIGTTAHSDIALDGLDLKSPVLLMIGSETDGLCRALKETCDLLAAIPMAAGSAASSLNVACAATVMLYEVTRQRN